MASYATSRLRCRFSTAVGLPSEFSLPHTRTRFFVVVDGKPIRASKRSAEWCLAGVKKCRDHKRRFMGDDEIDDFNETYDHAEKVYRQIIAESVAD